MRINKFLANNLGISRRTVDELIERRQVKINQVHAKLGSQVSDLDKVEFFNGKAWEKIEETPQDKIVLFYKPIFSLVSTKKEKGKKTIYDLLPAKLNYLKPAGRLDYMSEGLLVMTNNGDLINTLTHPKNNTSKEYLVGLKKPLSKLDIEKSKQGFKIDSYLLNPVEIIQLRSLDKYYFLKPDTRLKWYKFILSEGRNNQIRKMCASFGQSVVRLIRVKHGEYELTKEVKANKFIEVK